jgi:putative holliday junction resolvase
MPEPVVCPRGTWLAFDFGEKRIGVAVGEWPLAQAHPLSVIASEINAERFAGIKALIDEWRPVALVVGRPLAVDGSAHAMTARAARFANQLRGRFGLPVIAAEERFTSLEAGEKLRAGGHNAKSAKMHVDALAAQIILQSHFESLSVNQHPQPAQDSAHAH